MKNVDQEKLKVEFAASPDLQAEFGGDFKAFVAFKLAASKGRIQISRPKSCGSITAEEFRVEVQVDGMKRKLAANEEKLKRLSGLQKSAKDAEKAEHASTSAFVEACGVACGVDGLPLEE